jgi:hypothetical protein
MKSSDLLGEQQVRMTFGATPLRRMLEKLFLTCGKKLLPVKVIPTLSKAVHAELDTGAQRRCGIFHSWSIPWNTTSARTNKGEIPKAVVRATKRQVVPFIPPCPARRQWLKNS